MKPGEDVVSPCRHTRLRTRPPQKVFTVQMPHQRSDQACPDDNVAFNIKDLDKNNIQETHSHARRSEQGIVKPGEDVVSLPTHTASNPPAQEFFTLEMPHQRFDQACPDDNVASNIKGQDKSNIPETHAHAGRVDRDVVKSGEDLVSLPTHTASNPYSLPTGCRGNWITGSAAPLLRL